MVLNNDGQRVLASFLRSRAQQTIQPRRLDLYLPADMSDEEGRQAVRGCRHGVPDECGEHVNGEDDLVGWAGLGIEERVVAGIHEWPEGGVASAPLFV